MGKFISNLFLGALAIGLSIFTGSRTLDLLAWALPAGQEVYQWLGLAAFEGGMYFWSFYFVSGAKGTPQRSISLIMAVFSVVAVCVATIADMSLDAGQAGKIAPMPAAAQQSMIIFVGITVALNVAAFLACKLMSVEKLREIAEGQAEDHIYGEGLRAIKAISPSIASAAAPHLAQEWANRTWDKIVPGMHGRTEFLGSMSAAVPALSAGSPEPLPLQAPTRPAPEQSAPVVNSQPVKKSGLLARAKGFLGGKQEAVTLPQTGTVDEQAVAAWGAREQAWKEKDAAAQPAPQFAAPSPSAHARPARRPAPMPSVAAARHARRTARLRGATTEPQGAAAPPAASNQAPDRHRTCSECGTTLDLKNAKQLTCSASCRSKRSRRLAMEREKKA